MQSLEEGGKGRQRCLERAADPSRQANSSRKGKAQGRFGPPWFPVPGVTFSYATFDGKGDLADVIKVASLLILREGDYVGLSGYAQ